MRIAVVHPGCDWSVSDVYSGLCYGLEQQGVEVFRVTAADVLSAAEWHGVDAVILVTAIRTAGIESLHRIGVPVLALFTESPYEADKELAVAKIVDGCWTHERTAVDAFKDVNPHSAYLPHAWHPAVHSPVPLLSDAVLPAHDVVFVGSGFRERVTFFNSIDWTGIDLGLYGIWADMGLKPQVQACVRSEGPICNEMAAGLYRRAKIGLNLYRRLPFALVPDRLENWVKAESLNPRAYELAACGCFQVSEWRAEVGDVFGSSAMFGAESQWAAEAQIRAWLKQSAGARMEFQYQAVFDVAGHSWTDRAGQVLSDLHAWGLVPCLTVK